MKKWRILIMIHSADHDSGFLTASFELTRECIICGMGKREEGLWGRHSNLVSEMRKGSKSKFDDWTVQTFTKVDRQIELRWVLIYLEKQRNIYGYLRQNISCTNLFINLNIKLKHIHTISSLQHRPTQQPHTIILTNT